MKARSLTILVTGGALTAAIAGGIALCRGARSALEAEDNFHAAILVHAALVRFEREQGRRPTHWTELRTVGPISWSNLEWPRDEAILRARVEIDFEVLPSAGAPSASIRPFGPIYEGWENVRIE